MPVLVQDPLPVELQALLERRRLTGVDRHDEIWEGVLHMAPAPHDRHSDVQAQLIELLGPLARAAGLRVRVEFNLGEPDDFRVPDGGLRRPGDGALYLSTAAMVIEVLSPNDETRAKLPFYAAHQVDEVLIVDPQTRRVDWLALGPAADAGSAGEYAPVEHSRLIDLGSAQLTAQIDWPPVDD